MSANGYDANHNWDPNFDFNTLYFAAYAVFSAGLSVGLSNVTSGFEVERWKWCVVFLLAFVDRVALWVMPKMDHCSPRCWLLRFLLLLLESTALLSVSSSVTWEHSLSEVSFVHLLSLLNNEGYNYTLTIFEFFFCCCCCCCWRAMFIDRSSWTTSRSLVPSLHSHLFHSRINSSFM